MSRLELLPSRYTYFYSEVRKPVSFGMFPPLRRLAPHLSTASLPVHLPLMFPYTSVRFRCPSVEAGAQPLPETKVHALRRDRTRGRCWRAIVSSGLSLVTCARSSACCARSRAARRYLYAWRPWGPSMHQLIGGHEASTALIQPRGIVFAERTSLYADVPFYTGSRLLR